MANLDPVTIARINTLEQIEVKIQKYSDALDAAAEMKSYDLSDMQSKQKVESQDINSLMKLLSVYLEAKAILTGAPAAVMYSGNYRRGL